MSKSKVIQEKPLSEELYKKACEFLPGGVSRNTIYHSPYPHYVSHAKGCFIYDIDGTQRIDFANNMAALIHGHAFEPILEGVTEQLQRGTAYTMATEVEVNYAELLCNRVPGFDKIRFVNSGTEAVMAMIKASRAYTGKPMIAKAEGSYHGTYDFAEVSQISNPSNWGEIDQPNSTPVAVGTPKSVLDEVVIFPYNDIERTIRILNQYKDKIACVVIDPVPHRVGLVRAKEEFVEAIYKWTRENNSLMVFDEVVAFRVNYEGAQQDYKVKPDLTSLGKIIGGGFPVGAFTGRSDIMEILNPKNTKLLFPHSGTFSANPISMTAGRIAMEYFNEDAVCNLNAITKQVRKQIGEAIKAADIPVTLTGAGSMFRFHLREKKPITYREAYQPNEEKKLIAELLDYLFFEEKIVMINTMACMLSTAMTQKEIDHLSQAMFNVFKKFKPQIERIQNL